MGGDAPFPYGLPSGAPWTWIWDPGVAASLTLAGSPVRATAVRNSVPYGSSGWDAAVDGATPGIEYVASWRNGQPALLPGTSGGYLRATGETGPLAPYTLVYAGQFVPASGNTFRIITTGIGTIDGPQPTPFYSQSGTMRTFAGNSVSLGSGAAYLDLPFVAFALVNGSGYRVDLHAHGLASQVFSGAGDPGTNRFQGARFGRGEVDGFWNAPLGFVGCVAGALSTDDRAYLLAGFSSRFDIVVSP